MNNNELIFNKDTEWVKRLIYENHLDDFGKLISDKQWKDYEQIFIPTVWRRLENIREELLMKN